MKKGFNIKIGIILLMNLFQLTNIYSQSFRKGIPYTIHLTTDKFERVVTLPYTDNQQCIIYEDSINNNVSCTDCKNRFYGKGIDVSLDLKSDGQMETMPDGSKLWMLKITSSTAYGMQFYFEKFHLPFGATLYFYNESKTMILGAFTSDNNNSDQSRKIQFGTQWIEGNTIYIEYHEANNPEFEGNLKIAKVIHIYKNILNISEPSTRGISEPCNRDVSCPEGSGWEKEVNSVTKILAYNPSYNLEAQCTGALINNSEQNGHPYFLTANHCIDMKDGLDPSLSYLFDYSTWVFLFNYQTSFCSENPTSVSSSLMESTYGSTLLAHDTHNSPNTDYLLLELVTTPQVLASFGTCYAGWDISTNNSAPFVVIHHPNGDVKKISISNSMIESTDYYGTTINPFGNYWKVIYNTGVTEVGSSGAPLFNNHHRIIGQLRGGHSDCIASTFVLPGFPTVYYGPTEPDYYGKFAKSYNLGAFAQWLDPYSTIANSGTLAINTYCTSSCTDGVKNGSETDVDCGGNCPPCTPSNGNGVTVSCSTIQFEINNHSTINGDIINVCKDNIIISPHAYYTCLGQLNWNYTETSTSTNHIPCYLSGTPSGNPVECITNIMPYFWLGLPDYSCICTYRKLFLAIQECDENKNLIGPEYSYWFDIGQGFASFGLNNHLPPGASIIEGKYYKIKMATTTGGWQEYTSYIRVYTDNLLIQNKTITHDQFANNITIENSIVPPSTHIKVVAKTKIEILPNTILGSGIYYIDNFDCSQLDQFRSMKTNNISPYTSQPIANEKNFNHATNTLMDQPSNNIEGYQQTKLLDKLASVNIFPNPTTNEITIEFEIETNQLINADLFDFNNHKIGTIIKHRSFEKGFHSIKYDCTPISNGAYFIKFTNGNENCIKKLIILKP